MAYTPTVHSEDGDATSADGIILLNGATLEQAQAVGAVFGVGDGFGILRFYIDGSGGLNANPYPDPTDALVLTAATPPSGPVPAGTWLYAYTLSPLATGDNGETALSPTTEIVLAGDSDVAFSGVTVPTWADYAILYRSADGGTNWYQVLTGSGSAGYGSAGTPLTGTDSDPTAAPTDTGVPNLGVNTTLAVQGNSLGNINAHGSVFAHGEQITPGTLPSGFFTGGIWIVPLTSTGHPTLGAHAMGEMVMDAVGDIYVCQTPGAPGTWKKITLA